MMVANAPNAHIGRLLTAAPSFTSWMTEPSSLVRFARCLLDCSSQLSNGPRRTIFRGPAKHAVSAPSVRDRCSRETLKRWFLARYAAPGSAPTSLATPCYHALRPWRKPNARNEAADIRGQYQGYEWEKEEVVVVLKQMQENNAVSEVFDAKR